MTTLLITHPAGLSHDTGPGHPERSDRLRALARLFAEPRFDGLDRAEAPRATQAQLVRVHPDGYVAAIEKVAPAEGMARLDGGDTVMSPGTLEAVLRGVGGAVAGVDAVMTGAADNVFVAMRPPGHHAERATPMGFCVFNSVAVAAEHARAVHGAERVAIVDFDVHHGNGTQDIFWSDPNTLYASTHQMPLFPGTGAKGERGDHDTIVNAPLAPGDGGEQFKAAMEAVVLPRVEAFRPDLVIISAGFDAHRRDPLGSLHLDAADFGWITGKLMDIADRHAKGRVVSVLEGGYDLDGLARSAAAHVERLMGQGG